MARKQLILTPGGAVELVEGENVLWASADDESFRDEFPDEVVSPDDVDEVLDYLIEEDYLTDGEADALEVMEEDLDADEET